jgi:hypothetical protein
MRVIFYSPAGPLTAQNMRLILMLVGINAPEHAITHWTELEMVMAYDWAMRVHLRASDNRVMMRPCPYFVAAANTT